MDKGPHNLPPVVGRTRPSRKGLAWFILAGVGLACCAVLFQFNPTQHSFYPFCLLYKYTGLQCPGCGSLRAAHELLHGHFIAALRLNVLFVVTLFAIPIYMAVSLLNRGPLIKAPSNRFIWGGCLLLIVFGILRNIPNGPLSNLF